MKTFVFPDGRIKNIADGYILTFGLNEEQNRLVETVLPSKTYELFRANSATDLIAIPASALVINADVLNEDDRNMIFDFYTGIDNCTDETLFLIGSVEQSADLRRNFKCYENFDEFAVSMKYHLLTALRKSREAKAFSNKLADSIKILSLIRSCPGIKTREIAEQTELSIRTVQRRINTLQGAGEWIEYDSVKKGWQLQNGISILFGDYSSDV